MHVQKSPLRYDGGNSLLDLLIAASSDDLVNDSAVIGFDTGSVLLDSNEPITHVFFPLDMMISTTTLMQDASEVEVGSIGSEGMSGVQLMLGIDHVPGKVICQVSGNVVRLPAETFLQCMERSAPARTVMLRYIQATINFLEISIACNALHSIGARCARWLLLTQDRVRRDDFGLTQEFLAMMLGVRRATVNSAAQELHENGAISYSRGQVRIIDRAKLEHAACECYRLSVNRYNELLGQAPFGG